MSNEQENKSVKIKNSKAIVFIVMAMLFVFLGTGLATALVEGTVTSITISPEPIKIGSSAYVQFNLSESSSVTAKVYNDTGNLVSTLAENQSKNAGANYFKWDGRDAAGSLVPDGNYKFTVEAKDSAGTVTGYAEKIQLAAQAPAITNVAHSANQFNPSIGEQLTIDYNLSNDAKVTVKIMDGSYPISNIIVETLQTAGANSVTWDGKKDDGTPAGDGSYTYQIEAVSPSVSNFTSTYKSATPIAVESESPQITDLMVYPDPLQIGAKTLSIRYNLSEDAKVTIKIVDNNSSVVKTILDGAAREAGYKSETWDGKVDTTNYIAEGSYSVVISAVDNFNNPSGEQSAAFVAANKPLVSNASADPAAFDPNAATNNQTNIFYNLSHDALVTVKILNGSYPVRTLTTKASQTAGDQSVIWDGKDDAGNIVGDGSYTFQIKAESAAVYYYYTTFEGTVTVEKGAPQITELMLTPNPFKLGTTTPLDIRYNLSEDADVSIDILDGDNTLVKNLIINQPQQTGYQKISWDGKDNNGSLVEEGIYTVSVQAVDNTGLSVETNGTVTAAYEPVITDISHSREPYNPADGLENINFTLSDTADVTVSILKNDKYPVKTINAGQLASGVNTVNWDGKDDNGQPVPDGIYTYKIEAKSPTVNYFIGTNKGTLNIETKAPEISDFFINPSTVKIGFNTSIKYAISEPASVNFTIYDTAGTEVRKFGAQNVSMDGYYSLDWDTKDNSGSLITTGEYTLKAVAVDNFNKSYNTEISFKAGKIPEIVNVSATPNVLNTGLGETTSTISYTVSEESHVTIKVFDSNNQLFKTLFANKVVNGPDSVVLDVYQNDVAAQGILTYKIDAASVIGYFKAQQVSGTIQVDEETTAPPTTGSACLGCHQDYPTPHPVSNCFGCHGNDEPLLDCAQCHPGWTHDSSVLTKFECEYCHNDTYSYKVPGHGDITTLHTAPLATDCQKCHEPPLNTEHPLHTDDITGLAYDCNTCHQSTVAEVVYAIDNSQKNCDACHGQADHESQHTPTGIEVDCTKCHIDSLTSEHLANPKTQTDSATGELNPWTCDTCHSSTARQDVQDAVYNSDRQCSACHTQANHQSVHETTALDTNCTTASGCHNNNLTEEHLNNPVTQTDPVTNEPKPWSCDTCHASSKSTVTNAVYNNETHCAACHTFGHNMNFAEPVPTDIPRYDGYIWTAPQNASLWAGESWMPDELIGGKVIISNRRSDVTGDQIWTYYQTEMAAQGWTVPSNPPDTQSNCFSMTFTKDTNKVMIWFYGGATHNASDPVLTAGYRLEIIYK